MHAKFFIADGAEVFVGSQNFDWRAISHIHELGAKVSDAKIAKAFGRVFDYDMGTGRAPGERTPPPPPSRAPRFREPFGSCNSSGEKITVYPAFSPPQLVPPD